MTPIEQFIRRLQKHCDNLTSENTVLKAQIEKMRCCGNCRHWSEDGECKDIPWWDKCYAWEFE